MSLLATMPAYIIGAINILDIWGNVLEQGGVTRWPCREDRPTLPSLYKPRCNPVRWPRHRVGHAGVMWKAVRSRVLVDRWPARLLAMSLLAFIIVTTMQHRWIAGQTAQNLGKFGAILAADFAIGKARILDGYKDLYIVGQPLRTGKIIAAYGNGYLICA